MTLVATDVCPHFGVCGGCSKQDIAYEQQLIAKENIVRGFLGDLTADIKPIFSSPETVFYRNKMEFSFGDERDIAILNKAPFPENPTQIHLGLHPKGRFAIVTPTPDCRLLSKDSQSILGIVAKWATERGVTSFVRKNGKGDLRHLVIREGKNTGERMVNLVAKAATPHVDDLVERLKQSPSTITTFLWSKYDGLSDVAASNDTVIYWGEGFIREKLGGVSLKVTPPSFMQTNTHAAEGMIRLLRGWVGEEESQALIDLYCGSGAIGLNLADKCQKVIGIELNKQAVIDARENAALSGIPNIEFLEGKAEDLAASLPVKDNAAGTTVVVDPPRAGLHAKMTALLLEWGVPEIFYVSCNPETLARDLRVLAARYSILDVQPMDFFPHTDHIETAVKLSLRGTK